jgi:iron complex outermembrane receptor protein
LYGATTANTTSQYLNDPNLKPEKSWTAEFSAEKDLGNSQLRLTYFVEDTRDGLFSQGLPNPVGTGTITTVQNVGRILTNGLEAVFSGEDVFRKGVDLSGSVTYADSTIQENNGYVSVPGDTIGKQQINIPKWRATALVSYRIDQNWSTSFGARYSGPQYRTVNNGDINGATYQGVTEFFTTDVRVRYVEGKRWSASFGIDNLNDYQYWNFHPYPGRSFVAEIKYDI